MQLSNGQKKPLYCRIVSNTETNWLESSAVGLCAENSRNDISTEKWMGLYFDGIMRVSPENATLATLLQGEINKLREQTENPCK